MATKTVVVSDLTGNVVDDAEHVSLVVRDHPAIESPVRLDTSEAEVKSLAGTAADFVVLEVHRQGSTEHMVIELSKFSKLFKVDEQQALESARRLVEEAPRRRGRPRSSGAPRSAGQKPKRDPEQLQAIREWLRSQGHEVSDRGRIKAELEDLYNQAHAS